MLSGAFSLLLGEPRIFLPRLATTALYSVLTLYAVGLAAESLSMGSPAEVSALVWKSAFLVSALPLLYFIDILSYAMYPRMVFDLRSTGKVSLRKALADALRAWRVVVALGLAAFAALVLAASTAGILQYMTYVTGNWLFTLLAAAFAVALALAFSVAAFFIIPSAVLDGAGVSESFRKSLQLGLAHAGGLFKLNLFFLFLVSATLLLAFITEVSGTMSAGSVVLFIVLRIIQAVVYTYVTVANPLAYMLVRVK